MKQAFCSECGGYVVLDEADTCPGGHPKPCYRDIRTVNRPPGGAVAPVATGGGAAEVRPIARSGTSGRGWVLPTMIGAGSLIALCVIAVLAGVLLRAVAVRRSQAQAAAAQPAASQPARIQANPDGTWPPALPKQESYVPPTAEQGRWALATCGILTAMNGERHDLLGGCEKTSANVQTAKSMLSQWWGVNNREDLLSTLDWIEQGGHRRDFDGLAYALSVATPSELSQLEADASEDPDLANKVDVVRQNAYLGPKSISGWDYQRYVFLCRKGYLAGYLSDEEAWRRIMPAARLMQSTFSSWKELGDNYLVGREFWSAGAGQQRSQFREAERGLLAGSNSPWAQLPWDLDLGPGA